MRVLSERESRRWPTSFCEPCQEVHRCLGGFSYGLICYQQAICKKVTFDSFSRNWNSFSLVFGRNDGFAFNSRDVFRIRLRQKAVFEFWNWLDQLLFEQRLDDLFLF